MIDTEALRKKVIDLAIQGKLTQQLPEDGNAEDLYIQIQEERAKLIKEGKIKKEKPLPEISDDEIPFEIPKNWKWVRFLDVVMSISSRGHQITTSELNEIGNYAAISQGLEFIDGYSNEEDKVIWDAPLVLFGDHTRNVKFIDFPFVVCSDGTHLFKFITCDNKYLYYWTKSVANQMQSRGYARHFSLLKKCLIPLPPLSEQRRIIDTIGKAFDQISIIDSLQQQYESDREVLKRKIIDAGIRGMLTEQLPEDSNVEDVLKSIRSEKEAILVKRKGRPDKNIKGIGGDVPFEIPNHWRWVRLGDIGLFKKGPFGSSLTKKMFVPKGVDTIKVYEQQHAIQKNSNLGTYYITKEYFETKMIGFEVCSGDIIVSCAGTIGESYIMPDDIEPGIINQALMRITLPSSINKRFFQYYFDANLKKNAQEESNGSAIKNIPPFDVLKNWYFPVSSYEEQERISNRINELISLIN